MKKPLHSSGFFWKLPGPVAPRAQMNRSGAEGGRTLYLCIANAALSQMSYGPMNSLGALLTGSSDGQSVTVIDDRGTDSLSGILVGARKSV